MNRGRLIAFEGVDGTGKSTQRERVANALRERDIDVVETREPTDGPIGRRIRRMAQSGETVAPDEELQWFFDDRREHVREVIAPALAAGHWVLTDRYYLSTVAYQGARGLDWEEILARSEREFPVPDVALLFALDVEVGLERTRWRAGPAEPAFEEAGFLTRAAAIFAALPCAYVHRVDARGGKKIVTERALAALDAALSAAQGTR
ncbi:MAG: dTMP kinase [Myxococcota bacterium]